MVLNHTSTSFSSLGLSPQLDELLRSAGFVDPTPIQELVIPSVLASKNILVRSQTGSGKTLAYLAPMLERVCSDGSRVLILAPTRELAQQIGSVCASLCTTVRHCVIVGGVEYAPQREALALMPNIIVATPGRLIDLLEQGVAHIGCVNHFVLDEVDQMLDLGFRDAIIELSSLRALEAQTLCFSATLPEEVTQIAHQIVENIEELSLVQESLSVERIEQLGYYVSREMMDRLLIHLLRVESPMRAIIFTRSRKMADRIVGVLKENSIAAEAMHSDRSQAAREHIISRFRSGETSILVATDVIARGIDVDSVTHVFNFGLPQNPEQFIHRVGRTARAGNSGRAISIFTPDEQPLLNAICRLMKRHIVLDWNHPYMTSDVSQALSQGTKGKAKKRLKHK